MSHDPSESRNEYTCLRCKGLTAVLDSLEKPWHKLCHLCATEAAGEALEVIGIFALHGRALKTKNPEKLKPLHVISQCGASALVGGAFQTAMDFMKKYKGWK